ncbi:MAG: hypothetical protein QG650_152, partial [Patescibacteria group bacterium]|nr:hypothetical protein [Patescibacteria group bacterium]
MTVPKKTDDKLKSLLRNEGG